MSQGYLLAIDIGTQGARAALFDTAGNSVASTAQEYALETPAPGWAQQDARLWWHCAARNIQTLLQQTAIAPDRILGVGVDSQMHAAIPLDRNGEVLVPAVQVWCDKRNAGLVDAFSRDPALPRMRALAANLPTTAMLGFKIKWVQQYQPEVYAQTWKFLTGAAYIVYRLTGALAMSLSEATGSYCLDARRLTWSDELIGWLGLDRAQLPPVAPATRIAGTVTPEAARLTGLLAGTPVAVGAGDFLATLLAAGLTKPGQAVDISGTSCLLAFALPEPLPHLPLMHEHQEIEGWVAFGVVESGGGSLRWFRDQFCGAELELGERTGRDAYDILSEGAARTPPGAEGLLYFPYLLGERGLGSPHARGVAFGLTPRTDKGMFMRAIMEGITFELRRTLEIAGQAGIPVEEVRVMGGAAENPVWNQIRADIYGRPVVRLATREGALLGTAMLAGLACGVWSGPAAAVSAVVRVAEVVQPNPANRARYDALFGLYLELHEHLTPGFERLHLILSGGSSATSTAQPRS
jgi:xylulokinase